METLSHNFDDRLVRNIQNLGAYIFKPITAQELMLLDKDLELDTWIADMSSMVHIVGFAVSKFSLNGTIIHRAMDDHNSGSATFVGTSTIIQVYSTGVYDVPTYTLEFSGIQKIQALLKTVGAHASLSRNESIERIQSILASNVIKNPPRIQQSNNPGSRKDMLECLRMSLECHRSQMTNACNRECSKCIHCVDPNKMVEALDSAIKAYSSVISQNKTGKYIRMADGSRKWMKTKDAEEMLKLPRSERK